MSQRSTFNPNLNIFEYFKNLNSNFHYRHETNHSNFEPAMAVHRYLIGCIDVNRAIQNTGSNQLFYARTKRNQGMDTLPRFHHPTPSFPTYKFVIPFPSIPVIRVPKLPDITVAISTSRSLSQIGYEGYFHQKHKRKPRERDFVLIVIYLPVEMNYNCVDIPLTWKNQHI